MSQNLNLFSLRKNTSIIDDAFTIFKQNYRLILKKIFIYLLPAYLINSIFTVYLVKSYVKFLLNISENPEALDRNSQNFMEGHNIPFTILSALMVILIYAAINIIFDTLLLRYLALYTRKDFKQISSEDITQEFRSNIKHIAIRTIQFTLVVMVIYLAYYSFIFIVMINLAFVAVFYAINILYYAFALALPIFTMMYGCVVAFERLSFYQSLKRTFQLLKKEWLSCVGLLYLAAFISYIFMMYLVLPAGIITAIGVALNISETVTPITATLIYCIASVVSILSYAAMILPKFAFGIKYHQLREKKEAVSLSKAVDGLTNA
ncbi:MAG: hypothetical protein PF637_10330 [Spirochaetes bacterium]|jgi:hypothetical protein|nr:hypothetical protein [Spirochaetota bacterium]